MKQEYIFIGPPGSGKGTQTKILSEEYNLPHIDTGSLLREEIASGSDNGKLADNFMSKGNLVPLNLVATIIKNRLLKDDCTSGFILDGFPRSMEQALALDDILAEINKGLNLKPVVFYFKIAEELLIDRLIHRVSCKDCGAIYNLKSMNLVQNKCPKCGGELIKRNDDNEEVAKKRFDTYYRETAPLIDLYKERGWLITLDASQDIETIYKNLTGAIKGNVHS